MKYTPGIAMSLILFISACGHPDKTETQADTAKPAATESKIILGGNMVKSEAPDAVSKSVQGYAIPRFDDGPYQSPIDIITDSTSKDSSQYFSIKFNAGVTAVENLGHTIQLDFKEGSTTLAGGKTFTSKQFHFHTPSEHMIDGMTFPLEMHIVNILKDSGTQHAPQYLVIALLF